MQIDSIITEFCPLEYSHHNVCPYTMLQVCAATTCTCLMSYSICQDTIVGYEFINSSSFVSIYFYLGCLSCDKAMQGVLVTFCDKALVSWYNYEKNYK